MKIRTLIITMLLIVSSLSNIIAKNVTVEQAQSVANNFMLQRIAFNQVNWSAEDLNLELTHTYQINNQPAIYVFTNSNKGFVLVSADDALTPVLGYSSESAFNYPNNNTNFNYLISDYSDQVKFVRDNQMVSTPEIAAKWVEYSNSSVKNTKSTTDVTVGPLLTTLWNQDTFYNEFCPEDPAGPGGHVYAGCVATAMSMIMNFYKYPVSGSGQHSYNASGYGTQTANYAATEYEWDAMQNQVNTQSGYGIVANALLQYHAGVSVNMQYGADGSGAYSTDVPYALKTYFKYSPSVEYVSRSGVSTANWENMLTSQLDAGRPVYYSGKNPSDNSGHAWVCDGYQIVGTDKTFHFNFGWSGSDNGYYISTAPLDFTSQHAMVRNIFPNTNYPAGCSAKVIEYTNGSIEDGSGPIAQYNNNLNCTWLIAPLDTVVAITINFDRFSVSEGDTLYVYNGDSETAPLLAAYSGSEVPATLTCNGTRVFLRFATDGSIQNGGWLLSFDGNVPVLCSGTEVLTASSGSFSDGSGPYNYRNNSACKFKIQPPYATDITLSFSEFDLVDQDVLSVFAITGNQLLGNLTGNSIPEDFTVPSNGFFIIFKTNAYYSAQGFTASYTIGNVSTKGLDKITSLNVTPNPATDYVMVSWNNDINQNIELNMSNISGKIVYHETLNLKKGNFEKAIPVFELSNGMYFLTLSTPEGKITTKVIKQ